MRRTLGFDNLYSSVFAWLVFEVEALRASAAKTVIDPVAVLARNFRRSIRGKFEV
jgi:hypothetical protein